MDMSLNKLWQIVKDGKAGVLPSMGSQRVGHNWVTEQYISHLIFKKIYGCPQKIEVVLAEKECWGAKGNHSDSYSGVAIFLPQFPHWLLSVHMEVSVWGSGGLGMGCGPSCSWVWESKPAWLPRVPPQPMFWRLCISKSCPWFWKLIPYNVYGKEKVFFVLTSPALEPEVKVFSHFCPGVYAPGRVLALCLPCPKLPSNFDLP